MSIYFLETEPDSADFFERSLDGHALNFVSDLEEVGPDARILSIFIRSTIDGAFLEKCPALELIATRSSGVDHIDLDACAARGVAVATVGSYGENTVAEHTFALILALARRLPEATAPPDPKRRRFSYQSTRGFDLKGKTLGVIGAGRIGLHTIRIARAFSMEVLAFDIFAQSFLSEILDFRYVPLDELLARSHIVTLHTPLRPETRHILNRDTLAQCRRGALIINTARGGLIDTGALLEALDSGHIGGAGLDVMEEESLFRQDASKIIAAQIINRLKAFNNPTELHDPDPQRIRELEELMRHKALLSRSNVIFTPHVAFNSIEAVNRINDVTAKNILAFLRGEPINLVKR
jgi:D-lactate dehydrogenase